MNKYIIPVCDIQAGSVQNIVLVAKGLTSAQDKLMSKLCDQYNWDNPYDYKEFVEFADSEDVIIGEITDIETL